MKLSSIIGSAGHRSWITTKPALSKLVSNMSSGLVLDANEFRKSREVINTSKRMKFVNAPGTCLHCPRANKIDIDLFPRAT